MALYTTLHLHNVTAGREAEYAAWFEGEHSAPTMWLTSAAGAGSGAGAGALSVSSAVR